MAVYFEIGINIPSDDNWYRSNDMVGVTQADIDRWSEVGLLEFTVSEFHIPLVSKFKAAAELINQVPLCDLHNNTEYMLISAIYRVASKLSENLELNSAIDVFKHLDVQELNLNLATFVRQFGGELQIYGINVEAEITALTADDYSNYLIDIYAPRVN